MRSGVAPTVYAASLSRSLDFLLLESGINYKGIDAVTRCQNTCTNVVKSTGYLCWLGNKAAPEALLTHLQLMVDDSAFREGSGKLTAVLNRAGVWGVEVQHKAFLTSTLGGFTSEKRAPGSH